MALYTELSAAAQSAYSELYESAQRAELHRSLASLSGSFQSKVIKGRRYWYYAFREALGGRVRQLYVGPDSEQIAKLRETANNAATASLAGHAGAAISHGCAPVIPKHYRIIRQLADAQFFRAGGLLIGSHAFIVLGNMLGVRWLNGTHTLDVDFTHAGRGGTIAMALPADIDIDVHGTIGSLEMGFLPDAGLDGFGSGSYSSPSEPGLRLDFLTPLRRDASPVKVESLKITLQPLKFMDYLIEAPTQAAVLSSAGAVVANVPDPARFALHKFLVAAERPISERAKSNKDLAQAAALIDYLLEQAPAMLEDAWTTLHQQGPAWRRRFEQSMRRVAKEFPEVHGRLIAASG